MKLALAPLAAASLALIATGAEAQVRRGEHHGSPYMIDRCDLEASRLRAFERRAGRDGVSRDEARIAASLRADLARICGGGSRRPPRRVRSHR
jgi:hypothetical protein